MPNQPDDIERELYAAIGRTADMLRQLEPEDAAPFAMDALSSFWLHNIRAVNDSSITPIDLYAPPVRLLWRFAASTNLDNLVTLAAFGLTMLRQSPANA